MRYCWLTYSYESNESNDQTWENNIHVCLHMGNHLPTVIFVQKLKKILSIRFDAQSFDTSMYKLELSY